MVVLRANIPWTRESRPQGALQERTALLTGKSLSSFVEWASELVRSRPLIQDELLAHNIVLLAMTCLVSASITISFRKLDQLYSPIWHIVIIGLYLLVSVSCILTFKVLPVLGGGQETCRHLFSYLADSARSPAVPALGIPRMLF